MSTFQPGMANPSAPLFEIESEIITYIPTSSQISFPDPIPDGPASISYQAVQVPQDPQPLVGVSSRLFSVFCVISTANIGNGKATLVFRIGQAQPNPNDFEYVIPVGPFLDSDDPDSFVISFTGLVRTLPGQFPRLYIAKSAATDTTDYNVEAVRINYKNL